MTDMDDLVMMAKNLGGALQKMAEERNQASEKLRDEHLRQFFVVPGGERPVRLTLLLDRCQRAVGHMNDTLGRMSPEREAQTCRGFTRALDITVEQIRNELREIGYARQKGDDGE